MFPPFQRKKKQTLLKFCIQTCLQEGEPINVLGGRNRVGTKRSAMGMKPAGHVETPAISGDETQPQCARRDGFGAVLARRAIGLGVLGDDFERRWRHWWALKEKGGEMRRERKGINEGGGGEFREGRKKNEVGAGHMTRTERGSSNQLKEGEERGNWKNKFQSKSFRNFVEL